MVVPRWSRNWRLLRLRMLWRLLDCPERTSPEAVTEKRFLALLLVFIFGISNSPILLD